MEDLAKYEIKVGLSGRSVVVVNGEDVSDRVEGVTLQAQAGQYPVVVLRQPPGAASIEGEGIVQIRPDAPTAIDAIVEFLSGIDPAELDKAVLNDLGMGRTSPMEGALNVLIRWAKGED